MIRFNKPTIDRKDLESVLYCMISDDLTPGARLKEFRSGLAKALGLARVEVFSSYLFAFETLFGVLEARPGDRVIMPSFARTRMLRAVQRAGLVPVLVDLGEGSLLPDQDAVRAAMDESARCVMVPHLFGIPGDLSGYDWMGPALVEDLDGALCTPGGGGAPGGTGRFVTGSFDDGSLITTGGGGMLGWRERGQQLPGGYEQAADYLMSDLNASLGQSQLKKLQAMMEKRAAIGKYYDEAVMGSSGSLVGRAEGIEPGYARYVVRTETPFLEVERFFKKHGIPVRRALPRPLHRELGLDPAGFPRTEEMAASLVCLPLYPSLGREEVERVARGIRAVL
ncbi:MAG: DegT/DnrJ/EryC1/StrS family aminotransferase [Spirochaetota bacterium]